MAKYIKNKKININKSNEVSDLKGIGEATWNFLSAIYNLGQDLLIADKKKNSFKQKVASKFTPKLNSVKTSKRGEKNTNKLASIERLLPPILARMPKKVKEISKFFKMNNLKPGGKNNRKSYAQKTQLVNNIREIFKIKEMFLNLQANKIKNI